MPPRPAEARLPSLNFLLLLLVFAGSGAALWHGLAEGRGAILLFTITGWVVSLCLHEWGHAFVAWRGGDGHIPQTGYLSLDPLRYADPFLSIGLPLLFIVLGGFGLPGGAVWIRRGALRGPLWEAATAAAGPLANVLFLVALAGLYALVPHGDRTSPIEAALAVSAYFQATALVLNLLPIPGLDGFGILRPFLPVHVQAASARYGAVAGVVLILLVYAVPAVGSEIFKAGLKLAYGVGIDPHDVIVGSRALRLF